MRVGFLAVVATVSYAGRDKADFHSLWVVVQICGFDIQMKPSLYIHCITKFLIILNLQRLEK